MAHDLIGPLLPQPVLLILAVVLDLAAGDPSYRLHPIRLMGAMLARIESWLRRIGADGYLGGIALFTILSLVWIGLVGTVVVAGAHAHAWIGHLLHVFFLYSLLALGDLLRHVWRVERAVERGDLDAARVAVGWLVGRDTAPMDGGACRRAAVESLAESLTDGFVSPIFWYALAGLPGLVLFKVASTMDSMVGYKTARYLRFGWCGARVDDFLNWVPARATWVVVGLVAALWPGCSGRGAFRIGFVQHAFLPGPNAGWSEAAVAGAIRRRLVGPIWRGGALVTEVWIGAAADPPLETHSDVVRAIGLVTAVALGTAGLAAGWLWI